MSNSNGYLTIDQAAELLQVHYNTIYRWLTTGVLPGAKIGESWRIKRSDIEAFFDKTKEAQGDG